MFRNRVSWYFTRPKQYLVRCRSGREIVISSYHSVFSPVGEYLDGDPIDPATVDVRHETPHALRRGFVLIIDNKVETVEVVT